MTRAAAPLALGVAALLVAAPAGADPRAVLGLRAGGAVAFGNAADLVPVSEAVRWQVPVQAEALLPLGALAVGAYGSWGLGRPGADGCGDAASCSASVLRAGAQATLAARTPFEGATPWAGAALGWEWAKSRRERLGTSTEWAWDGPEGSLQAGLAWPAGGALSVGPFAVLGGGRWRRVSVETPEGSASGRIADPAWHAWIQLGVRGTIGL